MATRQSKREKRTGKSPSHRHAWHERDGLIYALLALLTILTFAPAFFNGFLSWDDNLNVWKNASFNPPTLSSVMGFWKGPFLDLYVPLTYTVWGILSAWAMLPTRDSRGNQLDPQIFHAANILVHVMAVLLAYAILRRLVGKKWPAAAGALLFALHPLQVEPVAWVTGMKDVLCGALSLAALWQYIAFAQARANIIECKHPRWHYAASLLLFILAVLAKPSAVTVPALAWVIDVLLIGKSWKKATVTLLPMFALAAVAVGLSIKFQTVIAPADGGHVLLRPLIAADTLAFYLYKLIFPVWLGVHYHRAPLVVIQHGWLYFTWIAPTAVLVAALIFRRRLPWLLAALGIFVAAVLPVSGIVPFSFQQYATVADRYVYVAMLGPALVLAAGIAALLARVGENENRRRILVIVLTVAIGVLGIRSFAQAFVWHDNKTLFANALVVNPNSALAYNYLAGEMAEPVPGESPGEMATRMQRARDLAERAVELSPNSPDGYLTLGSIYHKTGDLGDAIKAFSKAAELAPMKAEALNSYGGALAESGKAANYPEAEKLLRRAIAINPRLAQAHLNLGVLLRTTRGKDDPEVFKEVDLAVHLDGGDISGQLDLMQLYIDRHDSQHAMEHANVALQIDPNNVNVQVALMQLYMNQHDSEHAMEHANRVLQLDPNNQQAKRCRDFLLHLRPQTP
ncbi:MAG TPA: tetratricopeptide repeat protein [Tepidisphaeraceae bacterium]|jgi:tetratricopeptide (TPR) repeat protein|nr:tetratricopeptide repeat protein [Tepidisphaeraceae bacterium]